MNYLKIDLRFVRVVSPPFLSLAVGDFNLGVASACLQPWLWSLTNCPERFQVAFKRWCSLCYITVPASFRGELWQMGFHCRSVAWCQGLGIVLPKTANLVKPVCYREKFMALVGVSERIGSESSPVAPEFKLPKMQHRDSLPPTAEVSSWASL